MSSNNEIRDKIKVDRATANSDGCKFQKREEKKPKNGKQKKKNPRVNFVNFISWRPWQLRGHSTRRANRSR